jgi:hypothetical protein
VTGHRRKATIFAHLWRARILLRSGEGHRLHVEAEVVDRLLDEVGVTVSDVLEVVRGDSDKQLLSFDVGEPRWLQPRLVRLTIDLLLESREDTDPVIQDGSSRRNE